MTEQFKISKGYFGGEYMRQFSDRLLERPAVTEISLEALNESEQFPPLDLGEFLEDTSPLPPMRLTYKVDKKGRHSLIDHLAQGNEKASLPKAKARKIDAGQAAVKTASSISALATAAKTFNSVIETQAAKINPTTGKKISALINVFIGIPLSWSTMTHDEMLIPEQPAAITVSAAKAMEAPAAAIVSPEFFCNEDAPAIWQHKDKAVLLTKNRACERLSQAIPEVKQTVEYTSQIAMSGLESGGFYFKIKGKDAVGVTQDKLMSFIDGWILTGGREQNSFSYPDFMAQFFQESKLGQYDKAINGNACGDGQIMPDTYPELVRKYGADHGLAEQSAEIKAIKDKTRDDLKTARSATARKITRDTCKDSTINVALSTRKNLTDAKNLQAIVKTGKLELPDGRTNIIGADIYLTHLHGPGAIKFDKNGKFLRANGAVEVLYYLGHQPNKSMKDIVPAEHYRKNINFFTKSVSGERQAYTVTEYYNKLRAENAFSKRQLPDLSNWEIPTYAPAGQYDAIAFARSFNTKAVNDDNAPTYKLNATLPVLDADGQPVMGEDNKPLTVSFNGIHGFRLHAVPTPGEEPKGFFEDPISYLKDAFIGAKEAPAYRAIIKYEQPTSIQGYSVPRIVAAQHI